MSHEIVFEVFDAQKHSPERKIAFNEDMLVYLNQTAAFTMADLTCRYGTVPDMRNTVIYDLIW